MEFPDNTPVPTLSPDGWVSNTKKKIDYLLSHFWLSEYSSSEIYAGHVASLPWLLAQYKDNMRSLEDGTQRTMQTYFSRYFPSAKVVVTVVETAKGSTKYRMNINIEVTDNEGKMVLGGLISTFMKTKFEEIALLNNEGKYEQMPLS